MALEIFPVTTIEECRQIEDLQVKIWRTDPIDVTPDHVLITAAKNGGVTLLARSNDRPIGFAFGFQGLSAAGQPKYCSHQVGVLPDIQSKGVGYKLKLAQRQAVLDQGIDLITWTYDPLISLNAYLNVGKLGAISQTYYQNLYGRMRSNINRDLETDRLEVWWRLNSPHVRAKLAAKPTFEQFDPDQVLNRAIINTKGFSAPGETMRRLSGLQHLIQIPPNIETIKSADVSLAAAWRAQTRYLFETAFANGYYAADFFRRTEENESYYVLKKE